MAKHLYARGDQLWCRLKAGPGKWISKRTPYRVGEEKKAQQYVARKQANLDAKRAATDPGVHTVKTYADAWVKARKGRVATWKDEEGRLRLHVVPTLGHLRLDELRPRHIRDWVLELRAKRVDPDDETSEPALAPRTIRHTFQTLHRMIKSAMIGELVVTNVVMVDKGVLPPNVDKDPAWRPTAIYGRAEVVTLISDERVPADRRVLYALQALAGLRSGEACGLRWRDYDATQEPLGRLSVLKTKTKIPRLAPVHPTLAAILAEWKLGRQPAPEDFIVPGADVAHGVEPERRDKWTVSDDIRDDLETTGLRHRRAHDLRRTFISLTREDGARGDLLEVVTHGAKVGDMISLYTTFPWRVLCAEVAKLEITRAMPSEVALLPVSLATPLLQSV
jgi:integrase